MPKRILFVFGNVYLSHHNRFIPAAIPILSGVAKNRKCWEVDFFDTQNNQIESDSIPLDISKRGFETVWEGDVGEILFKADESAIQSFQQKVNEFKPDLIAVSQVCPQNFYFLDSVFDKVQIPPNIPIVVGGVYPTIDPQMFIKSKRFDLVCVGEGEDTLNSILERIENNRTLKDIGGTVFINRETGESVLTKRNPDGPSIVWDTEPDYSMFEKFIDWEYGTESNRGCPFNCGYCGNTAIKASVKSFGKCQGMKYRSVDSLFKELETSIKRIPSIERIRFLDSTFLCSKPLDWLREFADRYAKTIGNKICWETYEKAEFITDEKLEILKGCGCKIIFDVGVESGSDELLRNVCNRNCKSSTVVKAFDLLHKHGITAKAMIILGLPHETRDDVFKTIELMRTIKPDMLTVSIFSPLPNTELKKFCIDKGYISDSETYRTRFIQLPEIDSHPITYPTIRMPEPYLSQQDVINLRRVVDLYVWLPKKYYPLIEKCEKDYSKNKQLFSVLWNLKNHARA